MSRPRVLHFSDPGIFGAPQADFPAPDRAIGKAPRRLTKECHGAEGGALSMGEWECEPGAWKINFHPRRHEFFQVLRGRLQIISESGDILDFAAGEAGVIPAGFRGEFHVLDYVHKRYVMFDAG